MKISLKQLRSIIRSVIVETGGGTTLPPQPVTRNPLSPSMSSREQIGKNSIRTMDAEEITPHLRDPVEEPEDCHGPVPPTGQNPYALPDPYVRDYGVLPTGNIRK